MFTQKRDCPQLPFFLRGKPPWPETRCRVLLACLLLTLGADAAALGDAVAGQRKAVRCAACHGMDGSSVDPASPSLAGLHAEYLVRQLKAFKKGTRKDPVMRLEALALSSRDMEDLAVFYAVQGVPSTVAPAALPSNLMGQQIYRRGISDKSVPACAGCHGLSGNGSATRGYPRIAGQPAAYLAKQLVAYRSGTRRTDTSGVMPHIARKLADDEIDAVAAYMGSP